MIGVAVYFPSPKSPKIGGGGGGVVFKSKITIDFSLVFMTLDTQTFFLIIFY